MKEVPNQPNIRERLRDMLQQIVDLTEDEFAGVMRYGQHSFSDKVHYLQLIQYLARRILALNFQTIDGFFMTDWSTSFTPVYHSIRKIAQGNNSDNNFSKQNWQIELDQAWRTFLSAHAANIALVMEAQRTEKEEEVSKVIAAANKTISDFSKSSANLLQTFTEDSKTKQAAIAEDFTTKHAAIDQALQAIASASKKVAVTAQAEHFGRLVRDYRWAAIFWGLVMLAIATGAILYVIDIVEPTLDAMPANATRTAIVSHTLPRVLIFSAIYFVMVWAGKNMTAAMHNVVINKHRVAGLNTLEVFQGATEADKPTRLAVLLQVTTSIFSHQVSGYVKEEATAQDHAVIDSVTRLVSAADGKPTPPITTT